MFDRLDDLLIRYEEVMGELQEPGAADDQARFRKLMKEQSDLAPIVEAYNEYKSCKQNVDDSLAMLEEESDEEMRELAKEELNESRKRIEELERSKYPVYRREQANDRSYREFRRKRIKRRWWRGESAEAFDRRVEELLAQKAEQRRVYRYRSRLLAAELARIEEQQEAERRKQKKLEKSYEDFMKLLTFVETVEDDDFWRSEVVQIAAHTTSSGALEVELVPRSGRHTILFGRLEDVDRKFDKLMRFYRNGLSTIGWDEYRTIDIRYKDRVICKK